MEQFPTTDDITRLFRRHAASLKKVKAACPRAAVLCIVDDRLAAPYFEVTLPRDQRDSAGQIPKAIGRGRNRINVQVAYL